MERKIANNVFGAGDTDSLEINRKIRLLISKKHPDKYVKYIGVVK
jgi:hypothetical protein